MTSEKNIQSLAQLELSRLGFTSWRNNTGQSWIGDVRRVSPKSVLIDNARPFHSGLCKGSSDIIGFKNVTILPEWVGREMAIFTAIECKSATGRLTAEQKNFLSVVENAGGISILVRNNDDLKLGINEWMSKK